MLSACGILPFGPKACISAVGLPRRLAKPWSPPVPKNPACDGLPMAWMRFWLCVLPFSTSPMTRSGIHLGHFWLLDCLQLFHTPAKNVIVRRLVGGANGKTAMSSPCSVVLPQQRCQIGPSSGEVVAAPGKQATDSQRIGRNLVAAHR